MRKIAFMIDGWFMKKRVYYLKAFEYNGPEIRNYCMQHVREGDSLYRIFYYDTEPLQQKAKNPVSGKMVDFSKTKTAVEQLALLESIKVTPNFALRLGKSYWSGFDWGLNYRKLKNIINKKMTIDHLKENDVYPLIQQKAVDMKLGIDITFMAIKRLVDVIIIITGDADFVPALKLARREGIIVGLDPLKNNVKPELKEHVDFLTTYI